MSSADAAVECCATIDVNQKATVILKYNLHPCKLMTHHYVTLKLKTKHLSVFNLIILKRQTDSSDISFCSLPKVLSLA